MSAGRVQRRDRKRREGRGKTEGSSFLLPALFQQTVGYLERRRKDSGYSQLKVNLKGALDDHQTRRETKSAQLDPPSPPPFLSSLNDKLPSHTTHLQFK